MQVLHLFTGDKGDIFKTRTLLYSISLTLLQLTLPILLNLTAVWSSTLWSSPTKSDGYLRTSSASLAQNLAASHRGLLENLGEVAVHCQYASLLFLGEVTAGCHPWEVLGFEL